MEAIRKCYIYNAYNKHRQITSFNKCRSIEKDTLYQDKFINRLFTNYTLDNSFCKEYQMKYANIAKKLKMPTIRDENYKYMDLTPLIMTEIEKDEISHKSIDLNDLVKLHDIHHNCYKFVIVDGKIDLHLSRIPDRNDDQTIIIGSLKEQNEVLIEKLGFLSKRHQDVFSILNSAFFKDVISVFVPENMKIREPVHILNISTGNSSAMHVNFPRVLLTCEQKSYVELIEEFVTLDNEKENLTVPLIEIDMKNKSKLFHTYIQMEGNYNRHMKATLVNQSMDSNYTLIEVAIGSDLARHDLILNQSGNETNTSLNHFYVNSEGQIHNLHSIVNLDHICGKIDQLHKSIIVHKTAKGIFDGEIIVNHRAQKTDAKQLSRNLLLVPKASINIKPNLKIIADDVKCSHGCTVSDLSEKEIFYLRSRGICEGDARHALIDSFGLEILQKLSDNKLKKRVLREVKKRLL